MNMESFRMKTKKRGAMGRFRFSDFARRLAAWTGRPLAFLAACGAVLLWAASGPFFGFSDTWQLVINTSTTIITFLMVFLIQNTQNRDTEAIQLKLDELIRATQGAHNALLDLEEIDDERFEQYRASYRRLAAEAREKLKSGELDTDSPEIKDSAPR
jgi:low affinity Fe/Cu permease